MVLRQELTSSINRFRTTSINHPIAFSYKNNVMTYFQQGKKWNMSKLFHSCFMPRSCKGILLPEDVKRLMLIENFINTQNEDLIIVPKYFGFDLLKPNEDGDPILLEEVRFYSIKNKLVLWFMKFIPTFKPLLVTMSKEFNRK